MKPGMYYLIELNGRKQIVKVLPNPYEGIRGYFLEDRAQLRDIESFVHLERIYYANKNGIWTDSPTSFLTKLDNVQVISQVMPTTTTDPIDLPEDFTIF